MQISDNAKTFNFNKDELCDEELEFLFIHFMHEFFIHLNDEETNFVRIYIESDYIPF